MTTGQEEILRRLDAIERLTSRIPAIECDLAELRASGLTRRDRIVLEDFMPAWRGGHGSDIKRAGEMCASEQPGVRLVIAKHGLTPVKLGKLLRKARKIPIAGHMVELMGSEANAKLWRVVEVLEGQP